MYGLLGFRIRVSLFLLVEVEIRGLFFCFEGVLFVFIKFEGSV